MPGAPLRPKLFALFAALLLLGTGLWARSWWRVDLVQRNTRDYQFGYGTARGRAFEYWLGHGPEGSHDWTYNSYPMDEWTAGGVTPLFEAALTNTTLPARSFPLWPAGVPLVLGVLWAWCGPRWRRSRRGFPIIPVQE